MTDQTELIEKINRLHTTEMGAGRISRNLGIDRENAVEYCRRKISDQNCRICRKGKNWYCETEDVRITINAGSYTIITARRIQ